MKVRPLLRRAGNGNETRARREVSEERVGANGSVVEHGVGTDDDRATVWLEHARDFGERCAHFALEASERIRKRASSSVTPRADFSKLERPRVETEPAHARLVMLEVVVHTGVRRRRDHEIDRLVGNAK